MLKNIVAVLTFALLIGMVMTTGCTQEQMYKMTSAP